MHQGSSLGPGSSWKWHGVDVGAGRFQHGNLKLDKTVDLRPLVGKVFEEQGDIVIAVLPGIAPRPRDPNSTTRSMRSPYSSVSAAPEFC